MKCKHEIKTEDENKKFYFLCIKNCDFNDFPCSKKRQMCYEDDE